MNTTQSEKWINDFWEAQIIPTLKKYIEIPAKSPSFDHNWKKSGHIDRALALVLNWIADQNVPGLKTKVIEVADRTPLLLLEVLGTHSQQVLMYGHLDKQPEMIGWGEGLGPWQAVRRDDKLYGRGGADDGYAVFACVCAVKKLIESKSPRPHIRIAIEFSEESGSTDLPFYFKEHAAEFGKPELIICLDSGACNFDQFWTTTSLRGLVSGILDVQVLDEGVHSGDASGVVPSSFRIARALIDRIENAQTGEIKIAALKAKIPKERLAQIHRTAKALGRKGLARFPFTGRTTPMSQDPREIILNQTWRATLSVTGAEGLPEPLKAGNVLRPYTRLKLSLRIPPTIDANKAARQIKTVLEKNPPYKAKVKFEIEDAASGWDAPATKPVLAELIQEASREYFKRDALAMGAGGTIPFMGMLGDAFPKAQFVITGVLGPNSNAHGPNEFIHLEFAKKLTGCVTYILANSERLKS